jgi:hypothetical protein
MYRGIWLRLSQYHAEESRQRAQKRPPRAFVPSGGTVAPPRREKPTEATERPATRFCPFGWYGCAAMQRKADRGHREARHALLPHRVAWLCRHGEKSRQRPQKRPPRAFAPSGGMVVPPCRGKPTESGGWASSGWLAIGLRLPLSGGGPHQTGAHKKKGGDISPPPSWEPQPKQLFPPLLMLRLLLLAFVVLPWHAHTWSALPPHDSANIIWHI